MGHLTPEVSKLLEQALSLSVEEQEALAHSLISNLDGDADRELPEEGVEKAWADEIKHRLDGIRSGKIKMIPYEEVRRAWQPGFTVASHGKLALESQQWHPSDISQD
jgi:putative addiction module component (TIGR02574 family)